MTKQRGRRISSWWLALAAIVACAGAQTPAIALESDQFTLPPQELADIGPEIDARLREVVEAAIESTNKRLAELEAQRDAATGDRKRDSAQKDIDELLDPMTMAHAVKSKLGENLPVSTFEAWIERHDFTAKPSFYKPDFGDTVLADQALWKPLLIGAMSPTIKVHGVLQGADKIGHLFQQGFDYYRIYRDELAGGQTEADAIKKAVDWGVTMEKTWGGQWWTGAYANADLAANYAGMKFYTNLGREVAVGERTMPPILLTDGGRWSWNPKAPDDWFAVYISEHFDEAFNPPWFDGIMRGGIRKRILQRGAKWVEYHHTDRAAEEARQQRLTTWHGAEYGHCGWDDIVTIITAYFDKIEPAQAKK